MTPEQVLELASKHGARVVDVRFVDLLGKWQHKTVPLSELKGGGFEDGFGIDGSSIRGWKPIHASDMLVLPDPSTAKIDPFFKETTLVLIGDVVDPFSRENYDRDPRHVARKAENYLKTTGIGDTVFIGPEPEFFIFDDVRYKSEGNMSFYSIDSEEAFWNSCKDENPNLSYKIASKGGYFPLPPNDKLQDMRSEMMLLMEDIGIDVECQHHEVATAGQCEIDMRFQPLLKMSDQLMWFKYIIQNVAYKNGKTATFMAKPLYGDNGSGMHTHISIWKNGTPLFAGNEYAGLSKEALYGIGGILKHCNALCAFTNPGTNSYRRLVPGYEAPVNLAYSGSNRSASVRIPMYSMSPKAKRLEFRTPDPTCNGYLGFSAVMMAVLDGIQNKINPGDPLDKNIYKLSSEELAKIPSAPGSLSEALSELEKDHEFLTKGNVFSEDLIRAWIQYKRNKEVGAMSLRPHPHEFALYYDC
jgi:glutamine synthetase